MINFGGPFTLNLYGEIILITGAVAVSFIFLGPVFLLALFSAAYSLILYAATQQGTATALNYRLASINSREINLLTGHT